MDPAPAPRLALTSAGEGSPLVLVHGFTQTGASLVGLADRLSGTHRVMRPDLPGHGASPPATGDLHEAARSLGATCGTASYVGYSLGGRVCVHLALDRPDLVTRLVLVSATAGIEDEAGRRARRAADEALADRIESGGDEGLARFLDDWLAGPLFSHLTEEQADRSSRLANRAGGLAGSLRHHGTGTQQPLWGRLSELSMPVLVLAGERDERFCRLGRRLSEAVGPNAVFAPVAGAGHAVAFERPEETARILEAFLRDG